VTNQSSRDEPAEEDAVNRITSWWRRLLDATRRQRIDDDGERMCVELARNLADMGPHAAGTSVHPSPGTERLLGRARLEARAALEPLLQTLGAGVARSVRERAALAAAVDGAGRAGRTASRAEAAAETHARSRPQRPPLVSDLCASWWFRGVIAASCVAIELLLTAPGLEVLSHGAKVAIFPLHYVLAALVGVMAFLAAEACGVLFASWLRGAPAGGSPSLVSRLHAWLRRSWTRRRLRRLGVRRVPDLPRRPPTLRSAAARAAGTGCLIVVVAMISALGWLISVRDQNVRAAEAIRSGDVAARGAPLPGLPLAAGGDGQGIPAGPIAFGAAPSAAAGTGAASASGPAAGRIGAASSSSGADVEGSLGPVGWLSIVAFLVAFATAAAAQTAAEHTAWRREDRKLRSTAREARRADNAAHARVGALRAGIGDANQPVDVAGRLVGDIADRCVQRVTAWEARVRELYLVNCRRAGITPVALGFPPAPQPLEEAARLVEVRAPVGRQSGGLGFDETFARDPAMPANDAAEGDEQDVGGATGESGPAAGGPQAGTGGPDAPGPAAPGPDASGPDAPEADTPRPDGTAADEPGSNRPLAELIAEMRGRHADGPATRRRPPRRRLRLPRSGRDRAGRDHRASDSRGA